MIRIITDSTSDIPQKIAKAHDIEILPLTVRFGDETFLDGVTLTKDQFYKKLSEARELPTTSQLNPYDCELAFQRRLDDGDEIVGIFVSSGLSGTFQSASIAAASLHSGEGKIHLVDSLSVSLGLYALVMEAVRLRDLGRSAEEIVSVLNSMKRRLCVYAAVDTLKYLQMGGRISAASAIVGTAFGITPIVAIADGKVVSVAKARGRKSSLKWLLKRTEEDRPDTSFPFVFAHSKARVAMEDAMSSFSKKYEVENAYTCSIGSVVGTHIGPGAVGVAYFK